MLPKRQFLLGGTALVASTLGGAWLTPAMANEVTLLNDILHGVSDALVREYIRENYRHDGRWDGRHWIVGTHRYSPAQYRVYLEGRYRDHKAHKEHPEHPHGMPPGQAKKLRPNHNGIDERPGKGPHKHDDRD